MVAGAAGWRIVRRGMVTRATVNVVVQVVLAVPVTTMPAGVAAIVTASTVHDPKYAVVPPDTVK